MEPRIYRTARLPTTRRETVLPRRDLRRRPTPPSRRLSPKHLEFQIQAALGYLTKPDTSLARWLASKSFSYADSEAIRERLRVSDRG